MESTIISHVKELISKLKDIYSLNKLERRRPSDVMMRCLQGTHSPNTRREKREGGEVGEGNENYVFLRTETQSKQ